MTVEADEELTVCFAEDEDVVADDSGAFSEDELEVFVDDELADFFSEEELVVFAEDDCAADEELD